MRFRSLFFVVSFLTTVDMVAAQVAGRWEGTAEVNGQALLIAFNISMDGAEVRSATMDVPAQGAKGLPCDEVKVEGDSLSIFIKMIKGRYEGKLDIAQSKITGVFHQGNFNTPLDLKRTGNAVALDRPQTPKPPFPYKSEDVTYNSEDKAVHLAGTLATPQGQGPFPVALLISGSGLQDRDETIFGHKPFMVIADYLTRRGIAVLRVDDRNAGKSTGPKNGTSADFAKDAMISLDFLQKRKDIDPKRIGLIGHSEGGMIAQILATERPKDVAFIISLAGPGENILDLMAQQNTANLKSMKVTASIAESYGTMMRKIMEAATTEIGKEAFEQKVKAAFADWKSGIHPNVVNSMTGVTDEASEQHFLSTLDRSLRDRWMQYFLAYDPTENLAKIKCPVLAINGEKDIQVLSEPNLAGWKAAGNGKDFMVKEMSGLNHLFQRCEKCTVAEYGELTETFSPEVLKMMGDWLTEKVVKAR